MLDQLPDQFLDKLVPLNELTPAGRAQLSEKAQFASLKPGQLLTAKDFSSWYIYILEGRMKVAENTAEGTITLLADSQRALEPLFADDQIMTKAVTLSQCRIVRFERQLFDTLLNEERLNGYEVEDVHVSDTEGDLFKQMYEAYSQGKLKLPAMPEVAMKIARIAEDPDAGIPQIAKIIQTDPTVAGAVIQAANSPLYRSTKPIDNIKNAVVRLGLKITRNLASSIALRETFQVKSPEIRERMKTLWEHSVTISALSYVIAQKLNGFDPERALMAGLLHDIGVIPILYYIEQNKLSQKQDDIEGTIQKLRGMLGVLVINYWGLDQELVTVAEECELWSRDSDPGTDYCDIVLVSQLYDAIDTPRANTLPKLDEVPAYRKLNFGDEADVHNLQILQNAEKEIASIKQLLGG
jgi:HD-like signal output (HDOD) protein